MAAPPAATVREHLALSYAGLAAAHAAVAAGRTRYAAVDDMIRARTRAGLVAGTISVRSLFDDERLKLFGDPACSYCGAHEGLSADHLIPRARGGSDDGVNLVAACRPCNSAKRDRDALSWLAGQGRFPGLMLLRRYLKLAFARCERDGLMDAALDDPRLASLPFRLDAVPIRFPQPAGLRL